VVHRERLGKRRLYHQCNPLVVRDPVTSLWGHCTRGTVFDLRWRALDDDAIRAACLGEPLDAGSD